MWPTWPGCSERSTRCAGGRPWPRTPTRPTRSPLTCSTESRSGVQWSTTWRDTASGTVPSATCCRCFRCPNRVPDTGRRAPPQAGSQLKRLAPVFRRLEISFDDTQRGSDRKRAAVRADGENGRGPLSAPSAPSATGGDQWRCPDDGGPGVARSASGTGQADGAMHGVSGETATERPKTPCRFCG